MELGPGQYATDTKLRARQRLWTLQEPPFDLLGWVVGLTGAEEGWRVLDVGLTHGSTGSDPAQGAGGLSRRSSLWATSR